jgi:hypothetical protein
VVGFHPISKAHELWEDYGGIGRVPTRRKPMSYWPLFYRSGFFVPSWSNGPSSTPGFGPNASIANVTHRRQPGGVCHRCGAPHGRDRSRDGPNLSDWIVRTPPASAEIPTRGCVARSWGHRRRTGWLYFTRPVSPKLSRMVLCSPFRWQLPLQAAKRVVSLILGLDESNAPQHCVVLGYGNIKRLVLPCFLFVASHWRWRQSAPKLGME